MAEHTPGPWEATHRLISIGDPLKNGRFVILQRGSNKKEDFFVCEMPFSAVRGGDARECEANARLIAAAPDMLEALMEAKGLADMAVMSDDKDGTPSEDQACLHRLRKKIDAAIARAKGPQS